MQEHRTIRRAEESDLAQVVDIYNSAIPGRLATADTEPVTVESRRRWYLSHSEREPLWVADDTAIVAGWLSLSPFYGRPAYASTKEVSVYVRPSTQRSGLASELLRHAVSECPALGIKTLLGFIFSHNIPSLGLFRKFGFERWGELPNVAVLDGTPRSLSILGKRL